MLAGLYKAPTKYAPHINLPAARARANVVLDNLVDAGFMTEGQVFGARRNPANAVDRRDENSPNYYLDYAFDEMRKLVMTFPKSYTERVFVVRTAIDMNVQHAAEAAVENQLRQFGRDYHATQAALALADLDGGVRAMVGGRDYGASQFNRAVDAMRQPGSSFKPYVYATALMNGFTPKSIVVDGPVCIGNWCPQNYGRSYSGSMTLTTAITRSVNVIPVKLSIAMGKGSPNPPRAGRAKIVETARKMGITAPLVDTPSLPIGSTEVSLVEHAVAYAAFPNKGRAVKPHSVLEVRTGTGDLVWRWDRDGRNEVLYVQQATYADSPPQAHVVRERAGRYEGNATMVILDGWTGHEKGRFDLPAPADDSFLFADLTGRGRREDLVVKDRYWNMWGVSHEGKVLWHSKGSVGHYPAIADVDGDGRDEVFVGYALIDHDGKVLFQKKWEGHDHQDAAWITNQPDGQWRLLFGNTGIHCLTPDGTELWHHPLGEAQHVVAGRFRLDSPLQFMVVDRTPVPTHRRNSDAWAILYLYDLNGKEIWRRQQEKGAWAIATVPLNWFGPGKPEAVLVYGLSAMEQGPSKPAVIYNGDGEIVDACPMQYSPLPGEEKYFTEYYGTAADVWGDSRDEVILFGPRGACIYTNARPAEIPTLYNETLYPGM